MMFEQSFLQSSLPLAWLSSYVVPIYKKGPRSDPLNYRPISLTSVICKTLERLVTDHLVSFLESNSLLSDDQFGFRSGRSTEDQLLVTYSEVADLVD